MCELRSASFHYGDEETPYAEVIEVPNLTGACFGWIFPLHANHGQAKKDRKG
jgi:hypothetical protein